jgi:glycosyltransferase involved in cell wall biosynthesis
MVVSDSGSSASILGAAGIPFRNGDHFDLAKKLELLMDDPGLRERTIMAGEEVLKRYHPDTVMSQILDFYASLLS